MELFREIPAASKQGEVRWKFFKKKIIGKDTVCGPMLIRYIITQTPLFGLYVHNILREDADPDCHDHPWAFLTWVVRGEYIEQFRPRAGRNFIQERYHLARSVHRVTTTQAHRITYVRPNTWTVILVGPKTNDWGFWYEPLPPSWIDDGNGVRKHPITRQPIRPSEPARFMPWREYTGATPDPMDS